MIEEPVLTREIMASAPIVPRPRMNMEPNCMFLCSKDTVNTGIRRHIKKIGANSVLYRLNAPRK
jgi:hypothetical protein